MARAFRSDRVFEGLKDTATEQKVHNRWGDEKLACV
jgi:hypothetical protein